TSFSAPCVAGLALLIKSMYPTMTNAECTLRIFQSCDSMPDPQYLAGNLGRGRINVTKAIYQPIRCHLRTTDFRLNDGNDNYPQANETVALITTMYNDRGYLNATNISATLSCSDPDITIIKSTATFPTIEAGRTGNCSADSFVFHVAANFIPRRVRFIINHTATPASIRTADTIHLRVGNPRILLVDDDNGANYERWYKETIDSLKTFYRVWNTDTLGSPALDTLLAYPVVVWFTGLDSLNTLTTTDQNNLTSYLNQGKNLFICGQNIGQDIGSTPFYSNYLHASYVTTHTAQLYAVGIAGDPIGGVNGDTVVLGGAGGAANANSCDGIRPVGGAYGAFRYRNYADTTVYGAIHFSNTYKVVYFGMPFEAINHTALRYIQKWEVMRRILTFFNEPLPQGIEDTKIILPRTVTRPSINIFPNPFSNHTNINFNLPALQTAQINIYNIAGELVKSVTTNSSSIQWDGTDRAGNKLMNGVYFCELKTEHGSSVRKAVILR
ncbi:MAG: T9SS type A sorting domain-containing protein, partial [Candidatus Latescibacteria bacterium]|nr:T9SS type A sorting domain-containing protein [Candidatus Latescibacterota bacterium]